MVRVAARGTSAAQIADIPVKRLGERTMLVRDVAQVIDGVEEATQRRVRQRTSGHRARRAEAGRRQHRGRRRRRARGRRADAARAPARRVAADGARRLDVHPRVDRRRAGDAGARRPADGLHRVPVPELVALDGHHRPHAADFGRRGVHRHADVRLHAERADADGPLARDRHADRRCDRRSREHRAAHAEGEGSPRGGARGHGGDRARRHGDDLHDHRGVHPRRVHGRDGRPVLLRVRHHRRRRRARVAVRQLHARPDAVVAMVRPGRRGSIAGAGSSAACCRRSTGGSTACTAPTSARSTGRCVTAGSCRPSRSWRSSARSRSSRCSAATSCPTTTAASIRSRSRRRPARRCERRAIARRQMVAKLRELPAVEYTYTTIGEAGSQYRPGDRRRDLREAEAALGRHLQRGAARGARESGAGARADVRLDRGRARLARSRFRSACAARRSTSSTALSRELVAAMRADSRRRPTSRTASRNRSPSCGSTSIASARATWAFPSR